MGKFQEMCENKYDIAALIKFITTTTTSTTTPTPV